jgi:type VI secretion system secreted protein VgrG
MPLQITQGDRPITATTPLGDDVLVPAEINGEEAVSRPFLYVVEFVSTNPSIAASDLLGKGVTLHLALADGSTRDIHGLVRRFINLGTDRYLTRYRGELVPWLWFLSLSSDCRTFENMSALDVVEQVCSDAGWSDFKRRVAATPPTLPYVVQYRESNLAFVSRLLEDAGLYYAFEHASGKHTLVFSDSQAGSIPAGGVAEVVVDSRFMGDRPVDDTVFRFSREYAVHPKTISLKDHDLLRADSSGSESSSGPGVRGERFDFLGDGGPNRSPAEAKLLIEAEEGTGDRMRGSSSCAAFHAGTRVKFKGGPLGGAGLEVHLLSVVHRARIGDVHASSGESATYENEFIAIPAATRYRPLRITPRPSVRGTQTANVVGAGDSGNIDVDDKGCILLEFPWDRGAGKDGGSKHRVHVASVWAGTQWGFVQIPRKGQEVLVEYLEGDLERPLVTGRVYNSTHQHPYGLPDNKTQSGWKSRTLDGGADNFNELRFEDKKGEEHVSLQAEKDLKVLVKNDETREVQHDRITTVKNDDTRTVSEGNDAHTVSKGNQTVTVTEGDQTVEVKKGKQTITVQSDQATTIKQGNRSASVDQGNDTLTVKQGNLTIDVKMGNVSVKADAGSIAVEAMQKIELKVGQNSVVIDMTGVTIKGLNVKAQAQVQAEFKGTMTKVEGQAMTEVKGPMTQVSGDGVLIAKGGITMIN